jgi:hypothetical protein
MERLAMSSFGLLIVLGGLAVLCRLLFTLAIHALPVFAGVSVAVAVFDRGAGHAGALIVALLVAMAMFAAGKFAFVSARSSLSRAIIGLFHVVAAAIAGYQATLGLARIAAASEGWCVTFAIAGAVAVGGTAWTRLAGFATAAARRDRA